jgi:hypothetical protein
MGRLKYFQEPKIAEVMRGIGNEKGIQRSLRVSRKNRIRAGSWTITMKERFNASLI